MARRKEKNGEKSPRGQCLTRPVPNCPSSFWLLIGARNLLCFSAQSEGRTAATVWNWSGKTLSPGALLAVLYFSSCHIFPLSRPHYLPLGLGGCTSRSNKLAASQADRLRSACSLAIITSDAGKSINILHYIKFPV